MEAALPALTRAAPPPLTDADLNKVMISGLFDLKGLRLLEKKIAGLKAIMAPDEDDDYDQIG
jgi:hypothetical protein